jgi:hypothetical protein
MKTPFLLLLIFFFNFICLVYAQNCSSLEEWNSIIDKEFPDLNTSNLRSGSEISNRILYNLYSDKYFVPFANKSFDRFNLILGTSKWKKLRNCQSKKDYSNLKHIGWLHNFSLEPLWNKRVTDEVKTKSSELNNIRIEYNSLVSKLKLGNASFNDIIQFKSLANNKFRKLMPSEVDYFVKILNEQETSVANKTLLSTANEYLGKEVSFNSLQQLYNFEISNTMVYSRADNITINKVNDIIKNKTNSMLNIIIPQEETKLKQIGLGEITIEDINSFYNDFYKSYSKFIKFTIVKDFDQKIKNKKTSITSILFNNISTSIRQTNNINQLNNIESKYLSNVDDGNATIIALKNHIKTKQNEITAKKQKEELERKEDEEALRNFVVKRMSLIKELRQNLRVKYESNFPDFEELQEILRLYYSSIKDGGKYNIKEANNFIKYVEDFGYMALGSKKLSVIESFKNSKGYRIAVGTLDGDDKNLYTFSDLIIPNAPTDIIELYKLELTSSYRDNSNSKWQFIEEYENIRKNKSQTNFRSFNKSGYYVNNGRCLYNMEIDSKGNLTIQVRNNYEGSYPVLTERLNSNTLKVTSWTKTTDIFINKGDVINFSANGKIRVGFLTASPSGIDGWRSFNVDKNLQHAVLMGKIGNGSWFEVGSKKKVVANQSGKLYLRINEEDIANNDNGYWEVNYNIE